MTTVMRSEMVAESPGQRRGMGLHSVKLNLVICCNWSPLTTLQEQLFNEDLSKLWCNYWHRDIKSPAMILKHENMYCSLFSVRQAANLAHVAAAVVYPDTLITHSKLSHHVWVSIGVSGKGVDHFDRGRLRVRTRVWSEVGSDLHGTSS